MVISIIIDWTAGNKQCVSLRPWRANRNHSTHMNNNMDNRLRKDDQLKLSALGEARQARKINDRINARFARAAKTVKVARDQTEYEVRAGIVRIIPDGGRSTRFVQTAFWQKV